MAKRGQAVGCRDGYANEDGIRHAFDGPGTDAYPSQHSRPKAFCGFECRNRREDGRASMKLILCLAASSWLV